MGSPSGLRAIGDGAGSLGVAIEYPTTSFAVSLVAGDLDRDGKCDLVAANRWGSTVSVLLGDGSGGFAPKRDFAVAAEDLALADVNRDGTLDLVAANPSGFVSVLLNGAGVPTVTLTATQPTATEVGNTPGVVTVTRTGSTAQPLTVNYLLDGSAIPDTDYVDPPRSVVLPVGASSATITVTPIDDALSENDETVIITLREDPSYAMGTPSNATVTIVNDDPPPTVTVTATQPTATEAGITPGVVTVTRRGSTAYHLPVNFAYGGTAAVGEDYTVASLPPTIPMGASSVTLTITPVNDYLAEGNETAVITLLPSSPDSGPEFSYTVGSPGSAVVTIIDNDIGNDPLIEQQWHLKPRSQEPAGANVRPAWQVATGAGVVIGIVDDGLQHTHPDLQSNYVPALSWDFNGNDSDPGPAYFSPCDMGGDCHGTAVAGVAAARGDNAIGVSGVAPRAALAGIRLISDPVSDAQIAEAIAFQLNAIHIANNSWGFVDSLGSLDPLSEAALETAIAQGRGGKGRIFVKAAGNEGDIGDNCNFDGFANRRYVISVGALSDLGYQSNYSEPCSALFVSAPSNGGNRSITTTDLMGGYGYGSTDYTSSFGGTSSSTPLVSGVVALMLSENPALTWRDVQHILARTSAKVVPWDSGWTTGIFSHHEKYGFGLVDAEAAVNLAGSWIPVPSENLIAPVSRTVTQPIPDNDANGRTDSITVGSQPATFRIEHVEVVFSATHPHRGDLEVTLTSPAGVVSRLATPRIWDGGADFSAWRFGSVRHWGESPIGTWTLRVADRAAGYSGTWIGWTLRLYGTSTHDLFVARVGTGTGTVASAPPGIDCGAICSASFAAGSNVTLAATPDAGSAFAGWSGEGCSGTGPCVVSMSASRNVTATFNRESPLTFLLTLTKTGPGTVVSDPPGIACGATCSANFTSGTPVTLTATPIPGAHFLGWSGEGCSGTGTCVVTVTQAANVTAAFLWYPHAIGLFRPSDGVFYLDANGNGQWDGCGTDRCLSIGLNGDIPLVGDWNGGGSSKVGLFRPSDGTFYLDYNGNGQWDGCGADHCLHIGMLGDIPLVGDWNGSGTTKVGAFRPSDGTFYLDYNGSGTWEGCGTDRCLQIGIDGDIPVIGDWDGTWSSKVGVFRPSDGTFYLDQNGSGTWDGCGVDRCFQIGMNGDVPLVGDWSGTASSKVGVFRPSDGTFYLDYNGSGTWDGCGTDRCLQIGLNGDIPLVGDWNGTGTSKVGTFRPSEGAFYLDYNGSGTWEGCGVDRCLQIGLNGDEPLVGQW